MIIQTGMRTDIPAFYAAWFANRLREGYVLVRDPYNHEAITKYRLDPSVVDMICFCTKNPQPVFRYMDLIRPYGQYWFVTITPYGKDWEPAVPDKRTVMDTFCRLSDMVGKNSVCWRYDPVIIGNGWTVERHIQAFAYMCEKLSGYTNTCVISFIDLYAKVRRNFPEAMQVPLEAQIELTRAFVEIAARYGITVKPCGESRELAKTGADCSGCMTVKTFEQAIGHHLVCPPNPRNRKDCSCYLTADIGQYNSCGHFCRYCYANADRAAVMRAMKQHDPASPLLIGHLMPGDQVHEARQESWIDYQLYLEDYRGDLDPSF